MKKKTWRRLLGVICCILAFVILRASLNAEPFMTYKSYVEKLFYNCGMGDLIGSVLAMTGVILIFGTEWFIKLLKAIDEDLEI